MKRLTTGALIFDRTDSAFLPPVNRLGQGLKMDILVGKLRGLATSWHISLEPQVLVLELFMGHVRELIKAQPIILDLLIGLINVFQVVPKHFKPMQPLFKAVVNLAMSLHPRLEQPYQPIYARKIMGRIAHDREVMVQMMIIGSTKTVGKQKRSRYKKD